MSVGYGAEVETLRVDFVDKRRGEGSVASRNEKRG
jgi:hypothetical protein